MIREEALDWWKEALHNLRQAKKIFEIKEFSVSSFLCHQAAEKALKAYYIISKKRLPAKGNNLIRLGKMLNAEEIIDELKFLNPHYTISRYPNAANAVPSEAYTEEIAKRCIEAAEKVINWVRNRTNLQIEL
ncbi:MAG: HEPN domain-containing protein [Thermoproteota archaeon]|nr:HEPN domain-containing protein [Thermoproteota archaeon]